jgi:hypothetical protein
MIKKIGAKEKRKEVFLGWLLVSFSKYHDGNCDYYYQNHDRDCVVNQVGNGWKA